MDEKRIDSYLFNEMPETERSELEDRFVGDDLLFAGIAERENDLVDRYVRNELSEGDRARFERSLDGLPARRQKVANASVLREFIAGERENKTITIAERTGFFPKLAEWFTFRSPVFQFASILAIVLLALASVFLLIENRRLSSIQSDLAAARGREAELASQIENERGVAGDLTAELDAERLRIAELESALAKLRSGNRDNAPVSTPQPVTIATLVLSPVGIRGGPPPVRRLELERGVTRVAVVVNLPAEAAERVSVKLNDEKIGSGLRVVTRNGEKSISITVPVGRVKEGINDLEVVGSAGDIIAGYRFSAGRK